MKSTPTPSLLSYILLHLLSTFSWLYSTEARFDFLVCLFHQSYSNSLSQVIYTPYDSSYKTILESSINDLRFASSTTPKPLAIITPVHESQIQAVVICTKSVGLQIRIRSGGHDFEGISYVSNVPFILLDMVNFRSMDIDLASETAWVEAGATLGELYHGISEKSSTLAFPGGIWPTVGVGGLISGGGYGTLRRKYGLAADNVIDAHLIVASGEILDRGSMGEDLFWAIRGGGGSSFGVILSWKIKLVRVPKTVTIFKVDRTLEEDATQLVYRWQNVSSKLHKDLDIRILVQTILSSSSIREDKKTIQISFLSLFLGGINRLLPLMQESFPELGLVKSDCSEVSWIQSVLFFPTLTRGISRDSLLDRTIWPKYSFKAKSDFVKKPISIEGLKGIWDIMLQSDPETTNVILTPYGGRMSEISESELPFPHRAGTLYMVYMGVFLNDDDTTKSLNWIQSLYSYLRPHVSMDPRMAYVNYNDLDFGVNDDKGNTNYAQAGRLWGRKYFKNNFEKLARVKSVVDPDNFFRHEQSIPPFS